MNLTFPNPIALSDLRPDITFASLFMGFYPADGKLKFVRAVCSSLLFYFTNAGLLL